MTAKNSPPTDVKPSPSADKPEGIASIDCGIVMPISSTINRPANYWHNAQLLLHRAVRSAGFNPVNVWDDGTTDRISERIIANLFAHEIVVVDISDLNANVMLELGLRLASQKPTVAIVQKGQAIPFDIKDFHVIDYPGDMNILGMEDFFSRLATSLKAKYAAHIAGSYSAFLSGIIVDVLSPKERPVPADDLILSRLDELNAKVQRLEASVSQRDSTGLASLLFNDTRWRLTIEVDRGNEVEMRALESAIDRQKNFVSIRMHDPVRTTLTVHYRGTEDQATMIPLLANLSESVGIARTRLRFIDRPE